MKNNSLYYTESEAQDIENKRMCSAEDLTFNVTEDILIHMEDNNVSKSDLAGRLGKTKAYVSQLLSGSRNMTLRTLSDISFALNIKPSINFEDLDKTICETTAIISKPSITWKDVSTDQNEVSANLDLSSNHRSSNVIYRKRKTFWENKAA